MIIMSQGEKNVQFDRGLNAGDPRLQGECSTD